MERIIERIESLRDPNGYLSTCPLISVRIPIKATAREPTKQAGYISAISAIHAQPLLRKAAGPYIGSFADIEA